MRREFPPQWLVHLQRHVPFFARMEADHKERFLGMVHAFVLEKHFIGAGGQEIDDEVRIVIAAAAVRLVLHLSLSYYDRLTEIVVYPAHYQHPDDDGTVVLGEAHAWGTVVLSYSAVLQGLANPRDGHDTATHEFAHVLDRADGQFDGTPQLRAGDHYRAWAQVMSTHYLQLRQRRGRRRRSPLRDYGAINEAEFFAVATETFFEKPTQLQEQAPELYEELRRFYRHDPASR